MPLTTQEYKWVPPYCQLSPKKCWGISLQCIGIPSGIPSHLTTQEYKWVPPYCQLSPKKCWGISLQCIGIPSGIPSHLTTQEYKWVPPYCQLSPKKCWGISLQCSGIPSEGEGGRGWVLLGNGDVPLVIILVTSCYGNCYRLQLDE